MSATVVHCFFRSFYRREGHHYATGKQFTARWLPGKDFHSLFFLALFEGCGIGKFGIKHNRLPRNFFRPLNSGDTQFVCPRSRELINNSLFKDDLLYILALAEKEIAGFLIVACHHETAYDLHCRMQQDYKRYATSDILTYVSTG